MVQNIYILLTPPPKEHHNVIDNLNTIVQVMQTQNYELEVFAQANAGLTRSKSAVMEQLSYMTMTMNAMQVQLKTFSLAPTDLTRNKTKHYYVKT